MEFNMEANKIIAKIGEIEREVYNYITNTEHWLFYWINNKEVQDFINEYPEDYEDRVDLSIEMLNASPSCRISFYDHPNGVSSITRYAVLATFRDSVKAQWMRWNGKVKELQIEEQEKELSFYKKKVIEIEDSIAKLKKTI